MNKFSLIYSQPIITGFIFWLTRKPTPSRLWRLEYGIWCGGSSPVNQLLVVTPALYWARYRLASIKKYVIQCRVRCCRIRAILGSFRCSVTSVFRVKLSALPNLQPVGVGSAGRSKVLCSIVCNKTTLWSPNQIQGVVRKHDDEKCFDKRNFNVSHTVTVTSNWSISSLGNEHSDWP